MKQSFFIFMVITLMLPQFVSAKRGKNSSQLTVISYNMRYGTEADGYVNYVKGANVAGFMKVAKAMMAQGIL
jgi:glutamate dehydrogenase/leucine dehydrogenase